MTTVIALIVVAIVITLLFTGAVCAVFKIGEKEGACKYGYDDEEEE